MWDKANKFPHLYFIPFNAERREQGGGKNNMKKLFSLMLVMASMVFVCSSCSEDEICIPQEVAFTLDYTFAESGSMTRASGENVYNEFYEKYIKTKQLAPTTYSLTFTNNSTGAKTTINNGVWENKDAIRLMEGEYTVTGKSAPQPIEGELLSNYVSDTVFLSFDETVNITKDMTNINLTAKYDSYLLLFDKDNCSESFFQSYVSGRYYRKDLFQTDKNNIIFIHNFPIIGGNNSFVWLIRKDKSDIKIELEKQPFEKGKYYYFNDMTNSFDIPKMESGN